MLGYCNFYWFIRLNHDLTWCNYFLSFVYWVFNANFSHFNWLFVCFVCLTVYKSCLALWYAQATMIWKYKLENSRNEQFQSFKLHAVLSGMIQSYVMLFGVWFCLACLHGTCSSLAVCHLAVILAIKLAVAVLVSWSLCSNPLCLT